MGFTIYGTRTMYDIDVIWFMARKDNNIENFALWFSQFNKLSQISFVYLIKSKILRLVSPKKDTKHNEPCVCNWYFNNKRFKRCSLMYLKDYVTRKSKKTNFLVANSHSTDTTLDLSYTINTKNKPKTIFYYVSKIEKQVPFPSAIEHRFIKELRRFKMSFIKRLLPDSLNESKRAKFNTLNKCWDHEILSLHKFFKGSYKDQIFDLVVKINEPMKINRLNDAIAHVPEKDLEMILKSFNVNDTYLTVKANDPLTLEKKNILTELVIEKFFFIQPSYKGDLIQISKTDEYTYTYDKYGIKIKKMATPKFSGKSFNVVCVYNQAAKVLVLVDLIFWNVSLLIYSPLDRYKLLCLFYDQIEEKSTKDFTIQLANNINMSILFNHYKEITNTSYKDLLYSGVVLKNEKNEKILKYIFIDNRFIFVDEYGNRSLFNNKKPTKPGILLPLFISKYKINLIGFSTSKLGTFSEEDESLTSKFNKDYLYFLVYDNFRFVEYVHVDLPANLTFKYTKQLKCDLSVKENVKVKTTLFRVYFNTVRDSIISDIVRIEWRPKASILDCLSFSSSLSH